MIETGISRYDGKGIGILRDDGIFVTERKPIHFFRKYQGFGLSEEVMEGLDKRNCKKIIFIYTNAKEEVTKFLATLEQFKTSLNCWTDTSMGVEDPQKFVSVADMEVLK